MKFEPKDPDFETRVRASFARQQVMDLLGATMTQVLPGFVEIVLPFRENLGQQHGFIHAGVIATIADSACGYAALSLMPPSAAVLTIEFKVNLLSPAAGTRFIAQGNVIKPGQNITVCSGEVIAQQEHSEKSIATIVATMMCIKDREMEG